MSAIDPTLNGRLILDSKPPFQVASFSSIGGKSNFENVEKKFFIEFYKYQDLEQPSNVNMLVKMSFNISRCSVHFGK